MMKSKKLLTLLLCMVLLCFATACQKGDASSDTYKLGDKMEDFTVTLSDGTETSLYGLLEEKKMVCINLWASWCGPCRNEFPYLQEAYDEMSDEVGLIALDVEKTDTDETVNEVKEELKLDTLPMGLDTVGLAERFGLMGIPDTIVVDKNGVICFIHEGSVPAKNKFLALFKVYTDPEYDEPVLLEKIPPLADIPEQPSAEKLAAALGIADENIQVEPLEEKYVWPFLVAQDGSCAEAANEDYNDSNALVTVSVKAESGDALAYDYVTDMGADATDGMFLVNVNGEAKKAHMDNSDWKTGYVKFDKAGEYTVSFNFMRYANSDEAAKAQGRLAKLRLIGGEELAQLEQAQPKYPQTLSGSEVAFEIVKGEKKDAVLTNLPEKYQEYFENPMWVLQGDEAVLRIKVGADLDPTVMISSYDSKGIALTSLEYDSEGFLLPIKASDAMHPLLKEHYANVIPSVLVPDEEMTAAALAEWVFSEAEMDAYVKDLAESENIEGLDWTYGTGETKQDTAESDSTAEAAACVVTVKDADGKPLQDVTLQICDESSCMVQKTDKDGVVTFNGIPATYEVHVLKAPEGYTADSDVYQLSDSGNLEIILTKN